MNRSVARVATRLAGGVAVLALLAACTATVAGTGHVAAGNGPIIAPSTPAAPPSGGSSAPSSRLPACPTVHDTLAHLTYRCLTPTLSYAPGTDLLWPVAFVKIVEPKTGWIVEEGSGSWGPKNGQSLGAITRSVRTRLVQFHGYGDDPKLTTVVDSDRTVGGVPAHVLQTTFTINPSWAKAQGTKVKTERLWLVALSVGSGQVSLWYTSVPDLVSDLWAEVPGVINSIKVS